MRVEVENGKYTYVFKPDGGSHVLRYGEEWRDVTGDKMVYCMAAEIQELRDQRVKLMQQHKMLVSECMETILHMCNTLVVNSHNPNAYDVMRVSDTLQECKELLHEGKESENT